MAGKTVTNFNPFQNTSLAGSRLIRDVRINGTTAYSYRLRCAVVRPQSCRLPETWRDLGSNGEALKIYQTVFRDDSVFAATENGVLAGNLRDNLLDFRFWKRYATGDLASPIEAIALFQGKLYAAVNTLRLYEHAAGSLDQNFSIARGRIHLAVGIR